jgi:hypothetical protein
MRHPVNLRDSFLGLEAKLFGGLPAVCNIGGRSGPQPSCPAPIILELSAHLRQEREELEGKKWTSGPDQLADIGAAAFPQTETIESGAALRE